MSIIDLTDGGLASRKFLLILVVLALICGGLVAAIWSSVVAGLYGTFISGIITAAGLYYTGNITSKVLSGKINASVEIAKVATQPVNDEEINQGE